MKKRPGISSKARHSPVARRLKSWKKGVLLAFLLAGAAMLAIGENNRALIAEVLRDPLSILAQRSPGERDPGALLQTKKPHTRVAAAGRPRAAPPAPTERVLSAVRTRPPPMLGIDTLALGPIIPVIDAPVFPVPPPLTGRILPAGVPIAFVNPPPSICCGGEVPPGPPVTPPVVPPAPIPEPQTWLTMILGFFAMGWALRRRRTQETREAAI